MEMGDRVRTKRAAKGFSQKILATKAGISRGRVSQLENKHSSRMMMDNFLKLCDAVDTNPIWILYGKGPEDPIDRLPEGVLEFCAIYAALPNRLRLEVRDYALYRAERHADEQRPDGSLSARIVDLSRTRSSEQEPA